MKPHSILVSVGLCTSLALGFAFRTAPIHASLPSAADAYEIDTGHSAILFRAKHLNVAYSYGRFNEFSGSFTFDAAKPENSKVEVEVKTESVDSASGKRDDHLRSPDFFDAKQFPTATFKSKSIKKGKDGHYAVAGDFTLRGVTKPVTIDAEVVGSGKDPWGGERAGFHGTLTIKRSDFGVNYSPESLGDEVLITVSVEGTKSGDEKPAKK